MFTYHGKNRLYLGARATLLDENREIASEWATKHIVPNPANSFILGKFVEANKANQNQQYFDLDGLRLYQPTISHAPMNLNHSARNIVGAFVATEMIYPMGEEASDDVTNPFIESLGVFWKFYFPEEYDIIRDAHENASLFYSMECIPRALQTVGGHDDVKEYPYEGPFSASYPDEINQRQVPINMLDPHFVGGALIIPPVKPGWNKAEVKSISKFMDREFEMAEALYQGISEEAHDLEARNWEAMMAQIISFCEMSETV